MAERSVYWRIATNFAKQRRDADKFADSLERVQRQAKEMDDSASSGSGDVEKATRRRNRAADELVRQARLANKATKDGTRITQQAVAAEEAMAKAASKTADALDDVAVSTESATRAAKRNVAVTEEEARAQERVKTATLSRERAALALEKAQNRLAQTEARHGQASQQYANTLLSVRSRQMELESATNRYTNSLSRLQQAQRSANAELGVTSTAMQRASSRLKGAANSVMNFPTGLVRGFGKAMLVVVPILALLSSALGYLTTSVSALSAGLIGVIGPIASMGNAVAALPQILSVAAGAIGTFIAAFSGLGDAVKAGVEQQKQGGKAAKDFARQEKQAARAIVMARRALRNANEAAADSTRDSNRALGEAVEAVNEAKEAEIDASRGLSAARAQARRDIEDMKTALRDLALSERGAAISVEEARRRLQNVLADPGSSDLSKQQAQLAYDEATARMDDVKKQKKRADKDTAEAVKKGVDGHDAVVSAAENEADAQERLVEAQIALNDTRRETTRAARDSAEAVADAQYALAEAMENANQVGAEGSATLNKYNEAMKDLSPAGREFVELLISMRGKMLGLRHAAQEGLLPGLGKSLVTMTKLLPLAEKGLFQFGQVIGKTAQDGANLLTSDAFMPMWGRLLKSNVGIMEQAGEGLLNLLEATVYLMDAARPFTEWLSTTILGWTEYWKELSKAGNETGRTAAALERTKEALQVFGGIIKGVWKTFKGFARASRKEGMGMLRGMEDITNEWAKWANSPKGQKELKQWFTQMRKPLSEFSALMGDITRGIFDMGKDPKNADALTDLISGIRDMGPAVKDLLENLQGDFGNKIVEFINSLIEIFAKLTEGGGGGLTAFVGTLNLFAEALLLILDNKAAGAVVTSLATALGVMAALKFTGVLAGLRGVLGLTKKIRAFRNPTIDPVPAGAAAGGAHRAAGTNTIVGGAGGGGQRRATRTPIREKFRERMASRNTNERGSIALPGARRAAPAAAPAAPRRERGGARKKSTGRRSAAAPVDKGAKRAAGGTQKMGKAAAGATGAAMGLSMALSFLPGPIGEIANKVMIATMILSALGPVLGAVAKGFVTMVTKIGPVLMKLVGLVGKAMMLIGRAMMANPWMLLVAALVIVGVLIYKHWDKIKVIIKKAIDWIINFVKKHWNIIKYFLGPLVLLVSLVVKHWDKIKAVLKKGVEATLNMIKKIWSKIKDWIINPIRDAWKGIGPLWDKIEDKFKAGADKIKGVFTSLKSAISSAWDGIKKALGKPVEFVVNTVINDWLIGNVNKLLGKIGLDNLKIDTLKPVKFARGGMVPGQGNRDSVDAQLMPGEFVLRRDAVKALGPNRLHALNEGRSYRGDNEQKQRYGFGDIVKRAKESGKSALGSVTGKAKSAWGTVMDAGGRALDLAKLGAKKGLEMLLKPLRGSLDAMPNTWVFDDAVKSVGNRLFDAAANWVGGAKPEPEKEGLNRGGKASGVSALLTPGEFVFNQDAASRIGLPTLQRMNRSGKSGLRAVSRFAKGGPVERRKKLREGIDGDAGRGNKPMKFAKGGQVPGKAKKYNFSDIKNYILKGRGRVKEKQYDGTKKADSKEKVSQFLREAYNRTPTDRLLKKFVSANSLEQTTVKGKKGKVHPALAKATKFAISQNGKPYVWGGTGPRGYDCSGFTGSITNVIKGRDPYSRLFATGNMASVLPKQGFKRGLGGETDYSLGWYTGNPGHTSGTLGKLNVESTGSHVRIGASARGANNSMYNHRMHLPLGRGKGTPDKKKGKKYTLDSTLEGGKKYTVPDLKKWIGGKSFSDVKEKFDLTSHQLYELVKPHIESIKKIKGNTAKPFLDGYRTVKARKVEAARVEAARPRTPAELYLADVENQAKREAEWTKSLSTISQWGYSDLVEDLMGKGIDTEGVLPTAIEASKNKKLAKRLNDAVKNKGNVTSEDLEKIMKTISYVSSSKTAPGLRDLARHLQMTDYDTVKLVEDTLKTSHFNPIKSKMGRIQSDIKTYRSGTFYANTGGQVPGVGNKDTVPAMLTPGEFVIRKQAARALGLGNLMDLNKDPQKFAKGGEVLAPRISSIPTKAVSSVSSRALARSGGGEVRQGDIYDIDIHNPVAEPGTRSMMKALQRQSAMPGSTVKKKGTES